MRILHVIPYVSPVFGGPPQVVVAMAKALIEKGHEVIIFSTTEGLSGKIGEEVSFQSFYENGYRLFPTSHLKKWFYSKLLIQELKKLEDSIDLVHLHIPFTATFLFAAKWAKKNKIPYVITPHGLLDRWSMDQKKIKKWLYYFFIEKYIIKHALKIHVTSLFEKNEIERLGLSIPLEVIPLPVIKKWESKNPTILDGRVNICDDEIPHILFVGRLHPVKGIPYLIRSLKILECRGINVVLDLAGSGDSSYLATLRSEVQAYGLDDYVIFHDYANERQKEVLYKRATAFVLPSLHENFGLAAAEAMLAGLPVVVSDQVGLAASVEEFQAGFVVPARDCESLANALQQILTGNQKSLEGTAIDSVRNEFGIYKFSERLNNFYLT